MLSKIESYRKFVVALIVGLGGVWTVVASADLSSKQGVYATIAALVTAIGVYKVPNRSS